jgi:hypothetical protein
MQFDDLLVLPVSMRTKMAWSQDVFSSSGKYAEVTFCLEEIMLHGKAGGSTARVNPQLAVDRLGVSIDRERA